MRVPNTDLFNFLFSFNFASLKYLYYFIKDSFYNCFLTKEAFLFNKQVGWNYNFLTLYNFLKDIFIFIWEQLTNYIPVLKAFEWLYDFLITCLNILKGIIKELEEFFKTIPEILNKEKLFITITAVISGYSIIQLLAVGGGALVGFFAGGPGGAVVGGTAAGKLADSIVESLNKAAELTKTCALYVIKVLFMVFNFIFKIMLIIGKFLITFVLKFLDIFYVFLKIWYRFIRIFLFIIKAFIIIIYLIAYLVCDETTEDPLINSIRKELYKKKK
jgi:hypothetical protein